MRDRHISVFALIFRISLATLVVAVLLRGGRAERFVAVCYVIAAVATELLRTNLAQRYLHVEWGVAGVDLILLAALLWAALSFDHWWLTCATALQLVTVLGHIAKLLQPETWPLAYAWMTQASSFPSLALLAIGLMMRGWRERISRSS